MSISERKKKKKTHYTVPMAFTFNNLTSKTKLNSHIHPFGFANMLIILLFITSLLMLKSPRVSITGALASPSLVNFQVSTPITVVTPQDQLTSFQSTKECLELPRFLICTICNDKKIHEVNSAASHTGREGLATWVISHKICKAAAADACLSS